MAEIRTFIAIAVAPIIVEQLAAVQQQLRQAEADVSWARPEGMHLTLKFLGNVPEERVPALGDALLAVAQRFAPFTLSIAGAGGFPTAQRPRVLWAGVGAGHDVLCALAGAVDDALAALGFPREERPFRPHLTLGRVKSPACLPQLTTRLAQFAGETFGSMPVRELLLMRSDLSPQGARYTALRRAALTAGTVTE